MTEHKLADWAHDHVFHVSNASAERSARLVMWITLVTMVVEIAAGWLFNSMALLADGWHMSSHALAIGLSALAYATSRRFAQDPRFAFGTWKIEILGAFASAMLLLGVALWMLMASVERLLTPQPIDYLQALLVSVLGLAVNLACALILGGAHDHGHDHDHAHDHAHDHPPAQAPAHAQHHDLNLRSAYVHVIADAATSVLAIAALLGAWQYGWNWLDPLMGVVGAVLVTVWAKGLLGDTAKVLLDREMDHPVVDEIRDAVQSGAGAHRTEVTDLHVWRVGKAVYACALTVVSSEPGLTPNDVRARLAQHAEIVHATIEIHAVPAEVLQP